MSVFRTIGWATVGITVARPVADVAVAVVQTTGEVVKNGHASYEDGYKKGWNDAKKYLCKQS